MIKIKRAGDEDTGFVLNGIKEICRIEKEEPEKDSVLIKKINKAIKDREIILAEVNNKPAGFIQFDISYKEPYGLDYGKRKRYCWVDWVFVKRSFRRKRIGKRLVGELKKICKKNKIREIMLDTFDINKKAKKFYSKIGFREYIHIIREEI